ncbi:MAG: hypothetical protein ACTSXT_01445 [Candidatus Helarchaeota archaeon]
MKKQYKKKRGCKKIRGRKKGIKNKTSDEKILNTLEPEKRKLIKLIWKLQPKFKKLDICLSKYSIKQLKKHIDLFKKKRG